VQLNQAVCRQRDTPSQQPPRCILTCPPTAPACRAAQPGPPLGAGAAPGPEDPQLALLEQLLWRGAPGARRRRWARPLRAVARGVLAFALRSVHAEVSNLQLQYTQAGDVGPWCVGQPALAADALRVGVRFARLAPGGGAAPEGASAAGLSDAGGGSGAAAAGPAAGPALAAAASTRFLVEGVSASLLSKTQQPNGHGGGVGGAQSAAAEPPPGGSGPGRPESAAAAGGAGTGGECPIGWDEWDAEFVVLRQWFAQVTLSVVDEAPPPGGAPQQPGQQHPPQPPQEPGAKQPKGTEARGARAAGAARPQQAGPQPPALQLVAHALGASAGGAARRRGGGGGAAAAAAADGPPCVAVAAEVAFKSLMLEASPEAAAVCLRLVNRYMAYDRFAPLWAARPQVAVAASPGLWWQHAGAAVLAECRRRLPVRRAALALARRREYLALYRALHAGSAAEFVGTPRAARQAYCATPGAPPPLPGARRRARPERRSAGAPSLCPTPHRPLPAAAAIAPPPSRGRARAPARPRGVDDALPDLHLPRLRRRAPQRASRGGAGAACAVARGARRAG
jgi:hypothetical protein